MKKILLVTSIILLIASLAYGIGPQAVNLGTADQYVILATTGITTTGATSVIGNMGVSPIAASSITGFGLIMHSSGTYATSSLVTGRVYAADYVDPTPSNLSTAVGAMETAYTDAAGRTNPDYTELHAGNLSGQVITPGLYKWSSAVLIDDAGFSIAGGPNDTWIFQIAQNLDVANGAIVTLSGGALPQNIFWQVAGQTTIGTTAQFHGIILCQTMIALNTGATVSGRLLAQTAVTLDQNSVIKPTDSTSVDGAVSPQLITTSILQANYPNPFNPETTIDFKLTKSMPVALEIFNLRGQKIRTLLNTEASRGDHSLIWNGRDDNGMPVTSSVYLYRLSTPESIQTKRMMLMF